MFLHFYAFKHHIRGNQSKFFMVRSGLEKYYPRKKEYFWLISESCLITGVFWINYGEPLYKHSSKLKYFPSPLYHAIQEYKRFLAACSVLRGASLSTFKSFDVAKGRKRAFCSLIIENSIKVSRKYFQKLMWPYLLTTKDSLMGKVWGKTFSRCEMLWTAPREIAT